MANTLGKIIATAPTQAAAAATPARPAQADTPPGTDTTLPDPSKHAKNVLAFSAAVAALLGAAMNGWFDATATPFTPSGDEAANFTLFAGFYVAAQAIERVMEVVTPFLPWWEVPVAPGADQAAKAAQVKADRKAATIGIAFIAGVAASNGFGLYFLEAVGMAGSNTVDSIVSGLLIAAGTNPLHNLIGLLQKKNSPASGTGASPETTTTTPA